MASNSLRPDCPYACNNGYVFLETQGRVACPHCLDPMRMVETVHSTEFKSLYEMLRIPLEYQDLGEKSAYAWLDSFNNTRNKEMYGGSITEITDVYTEILNRLENSEIYRDSIYFCFTIMDTDKLVYGTQILAALHGVGTVPYITLNRLSHLLYSNDLLTEFGTADITEHTHCISMTGCNTTLATRVNRILGGIDYTDYVTAPLCMLELTAGTTDAGFLALRDLLAERARLSLPTYVFGFCGMYKLAANGEYASLGQFEGRGLRKLTQLSLTRARMGFGTGTETSELNAFLEHKDIGITKDYGIYV